MKNTLLTLMIALTFSAMADESNTNNSVSLTMESDSVSDFISELQVAIYQHPTFLAAEASVAQSNQLVNIAKSNRRPKLSFQTSTTNRFSSSFDDKFSFFACTLSIAKHIRPRPYFAIKFIFLALESEVEIIKSPSFSLFSSSTKINIPPFLAVLIMLSIDAKLFFFIKIISNVFR